MEDHFIEITCSVPIMLFEHALLQVEEESEDGLHSEDDDEDEEEEEEEIKDEPAGFQALSGAGAQYLSSLRYIQIIHGFMEIKEGVHKLKCSQLYIFTTEWCKPLIFKLRQLI